MPHIPLEQFLRGVFLAGDPDCDVYTVELGWGVPAAMNGLAPVYKLVGAASASPHYVLSSGTLAVMLISNALVVCLIWVLESEKLLKHTSAKLVLYDKIELIVPERRAELIADLEKRVGVKVDNVEIGHVDFLKDAAFIKVYYTLGKGQAASIDSLTRAKDFIEQ